MQIIDKNKENWMFHLAFALPLHYTHITLELLSGVCSTMYISLPTHVGELLEYGFQHVSSCDGLLMIMMQFLL